MTLREANALAVERFGHGSYCEAARGRRTLGVRGDRPGVRFVFDYPPATPWPAILDAVAEPVRVKLSRTGPEGT